MTRAGPDATWPASLWQRFALDLDRARPGAFLGPWFTLSVVLRLHGPLRLAVLAAAVDELVDRHDILRTRLGLDTDEPCQVVTARVTGLLEVVDEADVPADGGWLHPPVAADRPSPLRIRVARRTADEHLLSLHLHHLMADPGTLWNLLSELAARYAGVLAGGPRPPVDAQYWQYTLAEAEQVRAGRRAAEQWWLRSVGDATFAAVRPDGHGGPFAFRRTLLAPPELAAVERLSRRNRGTTLVTLLAGTACAMAPHLGSGDGLMLDTLFSKRDRPQWQRLLGPCIVPAYLPVPRPPSQLDGEYTRAVRDQVLNCQRQARFPIEDVTAMNPFLTDPASVVPFFEYLPQRWPAPVEFGPVIGRVVDAAGPRDVGSAGALGIRVRQGTDGALLGHLSGDGVGWTEARTADLIEALPRQIRIAAGAPADLTTGR